MSLGIVIKAPEGIVLAAESRVTLTATTVNSPPVHVNFDNASKLLSFKEPHENIGVVTYGQAAIGLRTAYSFLPELESELPQERIKVEEFSNRLSDFFLSQFQKAYPQGYSGPDMTFVVAGYNEIESYGRVSSIDIPSNPTPREQNPGMDSFGITWGGQREFVDRLLIGYDANLLNMINAQLQLTPEQKVELNKILSSLQMQLPLQFLPLQDCIDLAIFFIRTTINGLKLSVGIRGVGGPIDVAVIRRASPLLYIQQKVLMGERNVV